MRLYSLIFAVLKAVKNSIILFFVIASFGCNNEIDINAPWKETPVVNAFLDASLSTQYFRITKTFQNASNMTPQQAAQISDSLYFDTLIVTLTNTSTNQVYSFFKTTGLAKDPGYFANDKNILYACNMTPDPKSSYKLDIFSPKSGNHYYSLSAVIEGAVIMPDNSPSSPFKITFNYDPMYGGWTNYNYIQFTWSLAKNAAFYDAIIRYAYTENGVKKYLDQYIEANRVATDQEINKNRITYYSIHDYSLNKYLATVFNATPFTGSRTMDSIYFVVVAGSNDLKTAVDYSKPNTSLLQVKPTFSNISGGALGIFTSRNSKSLYVPFDPKPAYDSRKNLTIGVNGFPQ